MADAEPMALSQDLGDAPTMAYLPVSLVAQQAARHCFRDLRSPMQVELGLGPGQFLRDDALKPLPFAVPVGQPPLRRCPECRQMNIAHPGILDRRRQLAL